MKLIFSQIAQSLPYPVRVKSKLSQLHSEIINYAISTYDGSAKYKSNIINLMNTLSDMVLSGDTIPPSWKSSDPFNLIELRDGYELAEKLGDLNINVRYVTFDIEPIVTSATSIAETRKPTERVCQSSSRPQSSISSPTTKEDLSIQPPIYPQFDYSKPWLNVNHKGTQYTIFTTLPIIPETQSQISVTTNVDYMTHNDLMRLFPTEIIHTRSASMYKRVEGLDFDDKLGVVFYIDGYSKEQIMTNLIEYPHFYKLQRIVDGHPQNFYSKIEVDGKLYNTLEVWDQLPDGRKLPKTSDFIKEYVVRRYLLERDNGVIHKFPMFGSLDKFLTLFMPFSDYAQYGYNDADLLAKSCVTARVEYKRSRNPIIRTVYDL